LSQKSYFEDKSKEENEARSLLSELFSSDETIPREIRNALAELFLPDKFHNAEKNIFSSERCIIIKKRSSGSAGNEYATTQQMKEVYDLVKSGSTVENALSEIGEKYEKSSDGYLKDLWGKRGWRRTLEAIWGKLPRGKGPRSE